MEPVVALVEQPSAVSCRTPEHCLLVNPRARPSASPSRRSTATAPCTFVSEGANKIPDSRRFKNAMVTVGELPPYEFPTDGQLWWCSAGSTPGREASGPR